MIKFIVMDVDGTLTDGKINIAPSGELFKAFHVRDGYAINTILRQIGVKAVIITGRESGIVRKRSEELHIPFVFQGVQNKRKALEDLLAAESEKDRRTYTLADCAYIGDDLPDLECMTLIKAAGGFTACPNDAVQAVKDASSMVSTKNGGDGAVREIIDRIVSMGLCEKRAEA